MQWFHCVWNESNCTSLFSRFRTVHQEQRAQSTIWEAVLFLHPTHDYLSDSVKVYRMGSVNTASTEQHGFYQVDYQGLMKLHMVFPYTVRSTAWSEIRSTRFQCDPFEGVIRRSSPNATIIPSTAKGVSGPVFKSLCLHNKSDVRSKYLHQCQRSLRCSSWHSTTAKHGRPFSVK